MNVLITGGDGFIGSHIVEHILNKTDWNISLLGTNNNKWRIKELNDKDNRIQFAYQDLCKTINPWKARLLPKDIDYVLHLASKTLVDDSIKDPKSFIYTNIMGTVNLFEYIRRYISPKAIINYGTDEVYGPAPNKYNFKEDDRWRPSSPYSASKCGQMAIGMAYAKTYGLPIIHTYTMNVFGERQSNDKLIPIAIRKFLENKPMTIHAKMDGDKILEVGSRHWLYAKSAADATIFLLKNGKENEHYNIAGDVELPNISMTDLIASFMNIEPKYEYIDFHKTRPGHDRRYSLDGNKINNMGWKSPFPFIESMEKTIKWYLNNKERLYEGIHTV